MDKGYVRLWRKSIDSGIIKNHKVWVFWTWCLMKANHEKDYKQIVGFQEVVLQPGDFIFGRKASSKENGLSEQNIRTCLSFLKKSKNLTIKSTNKFSIISIVNWSTYQFIEDETNQQSNQQVTSNQPASNHKQEPLNNKTKELKNRKPAKKKFSPPTMAEVETYFFENGYTKNSGKTAWGYYDAGDWKDSRGNQVKSWKQKMRGVWFKDENKIIEKIPVFRVKPETQEDIDKEIEEAMK